MATGKICYTNASDYCVSWITFPRQWVGSIQGYKSGKQSNLLLFINMLFPLDDVNTGWNIAIVSKLRLNI